MKIHKEGKKTIKIELLIYLIISIIILSSSFNTSFYIFSLIFLIIFSSTLYFFRVPERIFGNKDRAIYAPCDGKVVVIEETVMKEFHNDKRIQLSIFMSPLNPHNNLNPISGKVIYNQYHPGRFLFAWLPKASEDNEKNTIVIENDYITIMLRQIAGAFARRIITYPKINDMVKKCDELGFIKFGSRVDLFLPIGTEINVKLNQKVTAGQSIIATY